MKPSTLDSLLGFLLLFVGLLVTLFFSAFFGIPIIGVGLWVLVTKHHAGGKEMAMERPIGVWIVAVLTLFSSFALGCLFLILWVLNFVGFAFASSNSPGPWLTIQSLPVFIPLIFALFSFFVSIALIAGATSRPLWYALIAHWVALFGYFVWWDYTVVWRYLGEWFSNYRAVYAYQYEQILVTFVPLAYSLGCLLYFQKTKVKDYFHVK
jgi:hypothetical protein